MSVLFWPDYLYMLVNGILFVITFYSIILTVIESVVTDIFQIVLETIVYELLWIRMRQFVAIL